MKIFPMSTGKFNVSLGFTPRKCTVKNVKGIERELKDILKKHGFSNVRVSLEYHD